MSYPYNENQLIVNIKTGYDVKRVFIHYGDPFDAGILGGKEKWTGKREEICYKKRLKHQLWWTTTLVPQYKRCKYYFELQTDKETWYYFEDGFLTEEQLHMDGRMLQCFIVPWMNPSDLNRTPEWVNDTVWYQIFSGQVLQWNTGEKYRGYPSMENRTGYQQRTVWGESFRNPSEAGLSEGAGNQWNISESHYEGRIQSQIRYNRL